MSVVAIIIGIIAVVALAIGIIVRSGWVIGSALFFGLVALVIYIFSMYYAVDQGEAKVIKDWTGVVHDEAITTPGAHWKGPFEDAIEFDVRNQLAVFLGDGNQTYNGSPTNGPQITFADKDGVSANMDLVVLYSIDPKSVVDLVSQYQNQDDFRTKVIEQDIRSVPRDIPGQFTTIQMLTDRPAVAEKIRKALEAEWEDKGIIVEDVSIQEIRYSDAVKARFEEAQNAQTEVVKAQAEKEKAAIQADSEAYVTRTKAQAEADANNLLAASLTPQVLQSRWIEAVKGSNTIIVPQDFTSLGNLAVPQ